MDFSQSSILIVLAVHRVLVLTNVVSLVRFKYGHDCVVREWVA